MRSFQNYALAVLFLLLTVPMYRYIIGRSHLVDLDKPADAPAVVASPPATPMPAFPPVRFECISGFTYARDSQGYSAVQDQKTGRPVRCARLPDGSPDTTVSQAPQMVAGHYDEGYRRVGRNEVCLGGIIYGIGHYQGVETHPLVPGPHGGAWRCT